MFLINSFVGRVGYMRKRKMLWLLLVFLFVAGCTTKGPTAEPTVEPTAEPTVEPTKTIAPTSTEEPVELTVYSQLSSYWGEQYGWFSKLLLDKFNVKLSITLDMGEEEKQQADILIFGTLGNGNDNRYKAYAEKGLLLDWEANGLLEEHGSYIQQHMSKALEYNRSLTPNLGKVFGFGNGVASSADSVEEFFYTWDIRWDLYKELGYPEVKNLEELADLFEKMKKICPVDEEGNETYATAVWSGWDKSMQMNVKAMASAYYGYEEMGMGLYDTVTGRFYGALEENGPYLEMLRFFNSLYRKGLLKPASENRTYDEINGNFQKGTYFFSIFDYAGSLSYNTKENLAKNQYMAPLLPENATPLVYGMNVYGGHRMWTISAGTKYPELCMEIINWMCTPEGKMTCSYGPQGVIWDYDAVGNTYFTEFGKLCMEEGYTEMPGEYAGTSYWDGFPQFNNITWSLNAENPDSNGETYNFRSWKSNIPAASCDMEQNWRDYAGALTVEEYFASKNMVVLPATNYKEGEKDSTLEKQWEQVADCIVKGSWKAMYADSEEEFETVVSDMQAQAVAQGYNDCLTWCEQEAAKRFELEQAARE